MPITSNCCHTFTELIVERPDPDRQSATILSKERNRLRVVKGDVISLLKKWRTRDLKHHRTKVQGEKVKKQLLESRDEKHAFQSGSLLTLLKPLKQDEELFTPHLFSCILQDKK